MCCFATILCILGLAACITNENENSSHTHSYSTQWTYDEEYHWHKAICGHINETSDRAKHLFVDNVCSICGYSKTIAAICTVTFNANNGSFADTTVKEIEVEKGSHLSQIEEPVRSGYIFGGWSVDTTGNQKWDFEVDIVDGDMTLYAVWHEIPVSLVKINYYDGDIFLKSEDVTVGSLYEASYNPSMIGYKVAHWKDAEGNIFENGIITKGFNLYAEKVAKTYNIILDVNGGENLSESTIILTYDDSVSLAVPMREGHEFLGWYYKNTRITNKSGNGVKSWDIDENCTLTAKWEKNTYIVALNNISPIAGNISGNGIYSYGSQVTITAKENKGYSFDGWFNEKDELVSKENVYIFTIKQDVNLKANWSSFTVTAKSSDTNAGTVSDYNKTVVNVGEEVTLVATTKNGYTFTGWYNGDELLTTEKKYSFKMQKHDVVYTAKWIKVILKSENTLAGTVNDLSETYIAGESATATATTKAGYTFIGWYNGDVNVCDTLNYTFEMPTTDTTLTAKWIKVNFEKNIAEAGSISELTGRYIVDEKVSVSSIANKGYTWLGWFVDDEKITESEELEFNMPSVETTYTACWQPNKYIVTLDANGGILNYSATVSVTYGKKLIFNVPERQNYYFGGWFTAEGIRISSKTGEMMSGWDLTDDVTLVAKWLRCISFNSNGGSEVEPIYAEPGEKVSLPDSTKKGYTLSTWLFNGSACAKPYIMPDENVTLSAQWDANTYYIYYNNTSLKVTYGQYYSIPTPTKTGYTFRYFTLSNSNTGFSQSGIYNTEGSTYLKCNWRAELTRTVSSGCTISESSQNLEKGMTFTITYDGAVMKNFSIETNTEVDVTFTGPGWTYRNTKSCGINSGTLTEGGSSKMLITITIIDPSKVAFFNLRFTVDKNIHSGEGL